MTGIIVDVVKYIVKIVADVVAKRRKQKEEKRKETDQYRADQETFRNKKSDEFEAVHAHKYDESRFTK